MKAPELSPSGTTDVEFVRKKLRQRWELASVLNFLHVFKPVIGKELKISAEDIETALIEQNNTLAQLHVALLKGILPVSQILKSSDAWMVALSKTLSTWWPWVAKGDFPLNGAKGEEIPRYKELEPITRLVILKALCEVRADQHDAVAYIIEKMKNGTEVTYFRKNKLASDGNGVNFWYDGSETTGHRLYKEVHLFEYEQGKGKGTVPEINCHWETLATNLEEFNQILNELSCSKVTWEVALSKSIEIDVIPVLEKQRKKELKAQQRQQREQMRLSGFRNSVRTRSCRNYKPVDYRYDNYDRAIKEAIQYTNKRKTSKEPSEGEKLSQYEKRKRPASDGSNSSPISSREGESNESDTEKSHRLGSDESDDSIHEVVEGEKKADSEKDKDRDHGKARSHGQNKPSVNRSKGLRFSKRLAGFPGHTIPESMNVNAKNRSRQRPSVNTAVESIVVPDSEDESSSGDES